MKSPFHQITAIFLAMVLSAVCDAGGEWKFIDNSDDVALYARQLSRHSETQFKGICTVNRSLANVGSVLSDIPSYPKWFFKCIEAKKIPAKNSSGLHFFLYVAIDTPWPFKNRDVYYETEVVIDRTLEKVVITSSALKEHVIPLRKDYVRITDSELQWILEKTGTHRTRVIFINRTHAAGPFANYLSDPGVRNTIVHSLRNLKRTLEQQEPAEIIEP